LLGYQLVWTAHNVRNHADRHRFLAHVGLFLTAKLVHKIFIIYYSAFAEVARLYGRYTQVHLAYHGNYVGYYPIGIEKSVARTRLGLTNTGMTYLMLGNMERYKGIVDGISAFRVTARADDALVIAGLFKDDELLQESLDLARGDARIRVSNGFVEDIELQVYFAAADFMLLPFKRVSTSGSLLLSLSFGVPVIASAVGNVPEVVTEACGVIYPAGDVAGLENCMVEARAVDRERLAIGAFARALDFRWSDTAEVMARVLCL
jgi:glycosyltransferase involved in cell wall biosynthesis